MHNNPLLADAGLPAFDRIRPEHVEHAVLATLAANRAELDQLLASAGRTALDFDAAILPLERLSDRLHRVWAPVQHLQSVANTPELRAAYNACLPAISHYETEMGHNHLLYELYKRLAADLLAAGHVYRCWCTAEELGARRQDRKSVV